MVDTTATPFATIKSEDKEDFVLLGIKIVD